MEYEADDPTHTIQEDEVSRIRRIGLTRDPPGGWPLDHVFVGVATLRVMRELFTRGGTHRPWDLHLRTGVSPQGSADALRRLARLGIVQVLPSREPGHADWFRLSGSHDLIPPLGSLFLVEERAVRSAIRALMRSDPHASPALPARGGSATPAAGTGRGG